MLLFYPCNFFKIYVLWNFRFFFEKNAGFLFVLNSWFLATHKIDIGSSDIRLAILDRSRGQADILTIDLHHDKVDKEYFHLALLGLFKHILGGKSTVLFVWFVKAQKKGKKFEVEKVNN